MHRRSALTDNFPLFLFLLHLLKHHHQDAAFPQASIQYRLVDLYEFVAVLQHVVRSSLTPVNIIGLPAGTLDGDELIHSKPSYLMSGNQNLFHYQVKPGLHQHRHLTPKNSARGITENTLFRIFHNPVKARLDDVKPDRALTDSRFPPVPDEGPADPGLAGGQVGAGLVLGAHPDPDNLEGFLRLVDDLETTGRT